MSTEQTSQERIRELEEQVERLEERWALNDEVDNLAEVALRDRLPLDHTLRMLMPALARAVSARLILIRTFDETLALHDFIHAEGEDATLPFDANAIADAVQETDVHEEIVGLSERLIARRIDVAGEHFGTAVIVIPRADQKAHTRAAVLLHTWCEEVDNLLASIAIARQKAIITQAISDALKDPVLDRGLDEAIKILQTNVPFESLTLVFRHEGDQLGDTLRFKQVGKAKTHSEEDERMIAFRLLNGEETDVRELLGVLRYREEILITGARSSRVLGRLIVSAHRGEFNTFDRDLLQRFSDSLRQRIVDFNREWQSLKTAFNKPTAERLLREEGYLAKYLAPRERVCAVLFADIAGFTRLSEQVLVRPEAIGKFVDLWSEAAVEAIWDTSGVFDKMVGDCVIGIWGPPFFEASHEEICKQALRAAERIREHTRALVGHPDFPELENFKDLDVAIGVNLCPLFVGTFGPDRDFTGFSSGMNNTARLQGHAKGGEILCMQSVVEAMGANARFGDERSATVKNVAEPLRFRPLENV